MLFAAIATCLLFSTADVFSQRSRGGGSSGGHMEGAAPRPVSSRSYSSGGGSSSGGSGSPSRNYSSNSGSTNSCTVVTHSDHRSSFPCSSGSHGYTQNAYASAASNVPLVGMSMDIIIGRWPENEVPEKVATKKSFVISLPSGDFYYKNGLFYFHDKDKYVVHYPYIGFRVPEIPHFHPVIEVEGSTYHYYNSVFYTYNESLDYYEVVAPPKNMMVDLIPSYAKEIPIGNSVFYLADGIKFLAMDINGIRKFKIIEVDELEYSKNNKVTYYSCY